MADSCFSSPTRFRTAYLLCQGDADIVYVYDRGDGIAREDCLTHGELVAQLQSRPGIRRRESWCERSSVARQGDASKVSTCVSPSRPNANRYIFLDEEGGTAAGRR